MTADVQQPKLNVIKRILGKVDPLLMHVEEYILSYGIIILALLLVGNVFSRVLFNYSWQFVEEIAQTIVIFVTFLGLGYCVRKARHIRMTAIYDMLGDRTRKVFIIVISAVTGATMLLLAYWSAIYAWNTYLRASVTPSLRIPLYFIYFWVPFGFFMAAVEYILTIFKNLKEKEVYLSIEQLDIYEDECLLEVPCEFTPETMPGEERKP
ncbi:TRAP transporter small permease [Desulfoferrobacter suflitae]|uniref:TRAP transporter small permease n=1 Tax=Desulfoferrobacter suflitae TaxID=2865782 RepID=UPI00216414B7|nr:TRAP transporter small permease [Desulfoferrobacter suflitae]MCK8601441.1 TRAP transporter small permease [Desulfoferrobacter suflitae]